MKTPKATGAAENMRTTFHEMYEAERLSSARRAWDRAKLASVLRHAARYQGRLAAARQFGNAKADRLLRVDKLTPGGIPVEIDECCAMTAISVWGPSGARLHLPLSRASAFQRGSAVL